MSRQGNNYDNKYYKNPPYGSGNKGPGGNGSFGGGQGGGGPVNGGGGQMGGGGPPAGNMNWGMYGGGYTGNRHAGGNRGFNSSQGPPGYGSSAGGGQFGNNVRGTANTRGGMGGGGYSRHGEKGADYFVQDEVAGAGSRRIAPPAHSGAPPAHSGQYPYQAPSQIFGQHAPPQAHAGMYGNYPGYGGANYSDYFSNWAGGERFPSRGYGGDKVGGDREERDQEKPNLAQLPKSLSVTRFQGGFQSKEGESGVSNKDVARESVALPDAGEEASEAAKQPVGGCGGVERAGPPTSPGAPSSFGGNRRKQSTPQKVPTSPGSATLIITQKGLSPPETNSPQHETPFISPKVFQGSKPGSTVGKVSPVVSDKISGKPEKTSTSPTKPFPSPSKPVLKLNILEKSSDESDALVIDTCSPGPSKIVTPASKQLKSPDKMVGKNTGSLEGSKNDKLLLARQSTEGNLADKEDFSDDDIKVKPIVRKKRLGKSDNNKKLDESDSEAEPSIKIKRSPRNEIKMDAANEDSNKKKTSRSPKSSKTPEVSKVDKGFIVPQVKELKEADISSVRRRRSRGEMKEFPCDVNLIPEESNSTKPLIENSEAGSSPDKKSEAGGRRRRLSSGTQATKKKIFQQVEEDLEAMFAGLEDSDTEKRTKKKTSSDSASDEPKEKKNPVIKTKQKEEAPEISSELKSTSDRRRPGAKPRYTMDSEKNDVEPKKEKDEYSFDPEEFESSPKRRKEKLEEKPSSDLEEFEVLSKSKNERKKRGPKQGVKRVPQEQKVTDGIDDLLKETPPKLNRKKPSPRLGSKREKRTFKSSYAELDDDNSVFEESSQHTPDKDAKQKINRPKSSIDQNEKTIEETNKVTSISESTAEVDLKKPDLKILELTKKRGNYSKLKTKEEITETDSPSTSKRSISRFKSEVKVDTTPEKTRPRRRRSDIVDSLGESPIVEASKEDDDVEKGRDNSRLAVRTGGKSRRNASMKSPLPSVKSDVKPDDIVSPVAKKEENVSAKLSGEIAKVEIMKNEVKLIKIISPKVRTGTPDSSMAKTEAKETRSSGRKRKASVLDNLESPPPFFSPIEDKRDDVPKIRKRRSDNSESSSTTEKKSLPPLEKPHRTSRRARGLPVDPKEAKANEIEPEIHSDNIKKILESTIEITDISPMQIETKPSVVEMTDISVVLEKVEENLIESKDEDTIEVIKEIPSGGFLEKAILTNKEEAPKNIVDIPLEVPLEMKNVEIVAQKESIDTLSKPPTDPFEKEKDILESPKTSFALLHSTLDDSFSEDSPGKSPGKKRGRPFGSKNRSKDEKDFESDKEKKKSIKKEKPSAKLTDTDKENGSKNSSAKTSRRASIEDNSKGKGGKKKMKKQNEVEMLLEKFKGPFIHINGDFSSPLEVRVINSSLDSLDAPHKPSKSRAICDKEQRAKVSNFGHSSTLSRQYDHKNLDDSWVCVFCNQTTHWKGLGDLFGPYWIPSNLIKTPQKKRPEPEIKASHVEGAKKNKRRRKSSLTEEKLNEPCEPISDTNSSDVSEIWFHEDCLCWVPCVHLVGSKIVGLEESVDQTSETICCSCEYRGASVGCCSPGCRQTAHVGCAQREGWSLNIDTFIATCTRHA